MIRYKTYEELEKDLRLIEEEFNKDEEIEKSETQEAFDYFFNIDMGSTKGPLKVYGGFLEYDPFYDKEKPENFTGETPYVWYFRTSNIKKLQVLLYRMIKKDGY